MIKVELFLSEAEAEEFCVFMHYKRACGDIRPELNPVDKVCLQVLAETISEMKKKIAQKD